MRAARRSIRRGPACVLAALACACALTVGPPGLGHATGFTDVGQDIRRHDEPELEVHGYLRTRGQLLYNLDLDRGLTPSGAPLFPVPLADPRGQLLTHADLRLRMDLAAYVPSAPLSVKLRLDFLDNLTLGSEPDGVPGVAVSQRAAEGAVVVRRAYGEWLSPFGLLVAGRTGAHWGLGMLSNGGDCLDCDSGDAADRVAFLMPTLGHIWALAYDHSGSGPLVTRGGGTARVIDVDPSDNVRSFTFALLRWRDDVSLRRRSAAGKLTFDYGVSLAYRWQPNDVPASYLPIAAGADPGLTVAQVVPRDLRAGVGDVWLRLVGPGLRLELEAAAVFADVGEASLIPGVLLGGPVTTRAFGLAFESEVGPASAPWRAGVDAGFASGDDAPGFGVRGDVTGAAPQPGDLDGAQAAPPRDTSADNFRFHPDYHVDRVLFRELIGTVTDAVYVRPHITWQRDVGPATLSASLAVVASWAVEAASTPGGEGALGVEIDPTFAFDAGGFVAAVEPGLFFPGAGFDNPALGLEAAPGHVVRLRMGFTY